MFATHATHHQPSASGADLAARKMAAFASLRAEFISCFHFVQHMHGQHRFTILPVSETVRYLHALWVCDCKDRLLSVPRTGGRYEGALCLDLLDRWQQGDSAGAVAFLQRKLENLPFAALTSQMRELRLHDGDESVIRRLAHGRGMLLNRGLNLMHALDAIFALDDDELLAAVCKACAAAGHTREQIATQRAEMRSPLYSFARHPDLVRQNMIMMNELGVHFTNQPGEHPTRRSSAIVSAKAGDGASAQFIISDYVELTAPLHNNLRGVTFVDLPERDTLPPTQMSEFS